MNLKFIERSHTQRIEARLLAGACSANTNPMRYGVEECAATCRKVSDSNPACVRESNRIAASFGRSLRGMFTAVMLNHKKQLLMALGIALAGLSAHAEDDNKLPSWAFGGFERPVGVNPLITPNQTSEFDCPMRGTKIKWEFADTFNPAAVVKDGKICILYRAEDDPNAGIGGRTSRIGLAETSDGIHIDSRAAEPVMYPDNTTISKAYEWKGGCEDPRVVVAEINGKTMYVMTYTAWNNSVPRLAIATSYDLKTWTKHGPAFLNTLGGKYKDLACKSGSIVTEVVNGRQLAAKVDVNGKKQYLMYWGEAWVCAATSDDLVTWTPYVDDNKNLIYLVKPRRGYFDSKLTECGPPAVVTNDGIILFYNGKNGSGSEADSDYPSNTYAAGQILFDKNNPLEVKDRLDKPFFRPMEDFEKTGQYVAGTVFIEGLVFHKGKWFLYYGCADSMVGVAVYDPANRSGIGDPVTLPIPKGIINAYPHGGNGKLRCAIHSYSGYAADSERPFYLNATYAYPGHKWCDNHSGDPWVIFEFLDFYNINRFVFRDVDKREANCGNVPEYWLYVSEDGSDWQEVAHETNVGDLGTKDVSFTPVKARYVKFVLKKGTRPDGNADNAVRIYGCDIYGELAEAADRNGVVSIGKTILTSHDAVNEREQAINLIDGNYSDDKAKWCFYKADMNKDPYRYAVIDLESIFNISKFMIYDSKTLGVDENMTHYQIYVSVEKPDVKLITPQGDANTCWTRVVDKSNQGNVAKKRDVLATPVIGRYVKLVVPRTTSNMNAHTSRVYAFDVYGTNDASSIDAPSSNGNTVSIYPTSIPENGSLTISNADNAHCVLYSLSGVIMQTGEMKNHTFTLNGIAKGEYIIKIYANTGETSAKISVY